jgi:hypothetical protein
MTKTSAVFRKLSPKAAQNWHQNNGAKRRVVINDMDMSAPPYVPACCAAPPADNLDDGMANGDAADTTG